MLWSAWIFFLNVWDQINFSLEIRKSYTKNCKGAVCSLSWRILSSLWASQMMMVELWFDFCVFRRPSSLDAYVFGHLAPLIKIQLPNCRLQHHLKHLDNLNTFCTTILSLYFPSEGPGKQPLISYTHHDFLLTLNSIQACTTSISGKWIVKAFWHHTLYILGNLSV